MAQRDKAGFKSIKDSRFADNTTGQIGADDMRNMFEDAADSFQFGGDVEQYTRYMDDFLGTNMLFWGGGTSGAGSSAGISATNHGIDATEKATGEAAFVTGTDTTGKGYGATAKLNNLTFGFGFQYDFSVRAALTAASDGTDTYTARIGFIDSGITAPTDGAFFRYTHGTNSGKWQAVTVSNSVETAEDTGIAGAADTTYHVFRIVANSDATQVDFYIDGVKTNDITTNIINSSSRMTTYGVSIIKSAGTTSRTMFLDYADLIVTRSTAR